MKLNKVTKITESVWGYADGDDNGDDGQTRSQREMQELKEFVYGRINKITKQLRETNNNIHLEFEYDESYHSVFNEDVDDDDILTFRVAWGGSIDDIWEIVSYFCISSPVFHEDQLDDFNVEVLSFYLDVSRHHEILIDYDPLGFLDKWSQILSKEVFQNSRQSYVFRLPDQEQLIQNAKDALKRVKEQYD